MSHPEIGSLIRKRDEAVVMFRTRDVEGFLEMLSIIAGELEPEDRDEEFIAKVDKELNWYQNTRSQQAKNTRARTMFMTYKGWLNELNAQLWKGQYLLNKKYGVILEEDDVKFE